MAYSPRPLCFLLYDLPFFPISVTERRKILPSPSLSLVFSLSVARTSQQVYRTTNVSTLSLSLLSLFVFLQPLGLGSLVAAREVVELSRTNASGWHKYSRQSERQCSERKTQWPKSQRGFLYGPEVQPSPSPILSASFSAFSLGRTIVNGIEPIAFPFLPYPPRALSLSRSTRCRVPNRVYEGFQPWMKA